MFLLHPRYRSSYPRPAMLFGVIVAGILAVSVTTTTHARDDLDTGSEVTSLPAPATSSVDLDVLEHAGERDRAVRATITAPPIASTSAHRVDGGEDLDAGSRAERPRPEQPPAGGADVDCYPFGGNTDVFSGAARMRGNTYTFDSPQMLTEFSMELDFTGAADLWFYVLASPTLGGTYAVIYENFLPTPSAGQAFYSSGPVNVALDPNLYYGIGVAWDLETVSYFRDPATLPRTWALGTVEDAMQHGEAPPYTLVDYNHFTGAEYSMELCLQPVECYTFGGNSEAFSGAARMRGNTYTVDSPQTLTEFSVELDFTGAADLWFYVLESPTLTGTYTVISETFLPTPSAGQTFYSSGPLNVALDPNMYYGIGVAWDLETVSYFRDPATLPRTWDLGTVEDAMQHTGAPPYTVIDYNHFTGAEYSMELCLQPVECYTFGGNSEAFSGTARMRGNTYTVDSPQMLTEFSMELDCAGAADLWFYVLESPTLGGTYTVLSETFLPTPSAGLAFYSSGPLSIPLDPSMYYGIGVAWDLETVSYFRDPAALPRAWDLGTVEDAMQHTGAPPYVAIDYNHFTGAEYSMVLCFSAATTGIDETTWEGAPRTAPGYVLVRPNPFNPATTFEYALPHQGRASLRVYDTRGRLVRTLVDGPADAGARSVRWNGTDAAGRSVPSAIYFYRLELDDELIDSGKAVVIK